MRTAKQTLMKYYKLKKSDDDKKDKSATEYAIELGVEDLITKLMTHPWTNENGDLVRFGVYWLTLVTNTRKLRTQLENPGVKLL